MIELGDEAKDIVTGFKGIVNAKYEWLNGCLRFELQPPIKKNGELPEAKAFDVEQLQVVKKAKVKVQKRQPTGGPMPTPQRQAGPQL